MARPRISRAPAAVVLGALMLAAGAARAQGEPSGVIPGKSSRVEVRAAYGEPVAGGASGSERFEPKSRGLAELQVFYGEDDVVRRVRLRFAKDLPQDVAALFFDLRTRPRTEDGNGFDRSERRGRTDHYDAERVHFHVVDGIVREVWLTAPGGVIPATREKERAPEGTTEQPDGLPPSRPAVEREPPPPEPVPVEPEKPTAVEPEKPVVPPATPAVPRALLVSRVWCERASMGADVPALAFRAHVRARGLRGQEVACTVRLRTLEGRSLFEPSGGVLAGTATAQYDDTDWPALSLLVPLTGLVIPQTAGDALAMTFSARSGPLSASLDGEWLPSPAAAAGLRRPLRTLVLGSAQIVPGATPGPQSGPGFSVFFRVESGGMRGQEVVGSVRLLGKDGRLTRAIAGAPPGFVDPDGTFRSAASDIAQSDASLWDPFRLFVPYQLLDLAPARSHTLTVVSSVSAGGVLGFQEEECTISIPPR